MKEANISLRNASLSRRKLNDITSSDVITAPLVEGIGGGIGFGDLFPGYDTKTKPFRGWDCTIPYYIIGKLAQNRTHCPREEDFFVPSPTTENSRMIFRYPSSPLLLNDSKPCSWSEPLESERYLLFVRTVSRKV